MQAPEITYIPPAKENLLYSVLDKPKGGISEAFKSIVDRLKSERSKMGRIIIFCKTYNNVIFLDRN